jgi:1-acyl-sn-glycerol-3-phosphate acyltransferase
LENLQGHRSAVLAANHLSGLDIPVLYVGLPVSFRIVAKKELFRLPFLGWHLKRSGQIPVDDKNARASFRSLQVGVEALKHGHPVVIFPEGGRSRSGRLLPFMSGPFYMAVKAGVPIIPMAIIGTYETLPMNTYHLMPRLLRLVIGTPIPTEGCTARDMDELSAKAEAAIRQLLSEDSTQS